MKLFENSNKKHLLITGSKGIGKSTLLKEILKGHSRYGGIVTEIVIDRDSTDKVILEDILNSSVCVDIGKKINNKMQPLIGGFEDTGALLLNRYRNSDRDLIVIDEIGFLEIEAKRYIKELFLCFEDKMVIAVLRKENNELINRIKKNEQTFLIDLDEFCR
ncbi:MAG: AAA family ATPase [Tissierellia bacterium]|nr:AAA family ATPase [Tissierellia bacterium]